MELLIYVAGFGGALLLVSGLVSLLGKSRVFRNAFNKFFALTDEDWGNE